VTFLWADPDRKPRRPVNRADRIVGGALTVFVVVAAAVWLALTL
jgi:hypothetical protein